MLKTVVLLYLLIGILLLMFLEVFWDHLGMEEEGVELTITLRVGIVLLWPLLAVGVIIGLLNNSDGDNGTVGPGYGT